MRTIEPSPARRGQGEVYAARPVPPRPHRALGFRPAFPLRTPHPCPSPSRRGVLVAVPEASWERGATLARRRRTHPAKRHASGRPPLGDGMRAIIRGGWEGGDCFIFYPDIEHRNSDRFCAAIFGDAAARLYRHQQALPDRIRVIVPSLALRPCRSNCR